jgi:hypothetical protein
VPITLQFLQENNGKLHHLLELIQQQESGPIRITAADLAGLLSELQKVGQLREERSCNEAALAAEFAKYRKALEHLRAILPKLQARYVAEKARLERDRKHLYAASGWAHSQEMLHHR